MKLERVMLKPIERILFYLKPFRGFRRLDLLFVSKVLANRRLIFSCQIQGVRMKLASNPEDDLFNLLRSGKFSSWEPGSLKLWTSICRRSSVVVDVGAYSGVYSILAHKIGVEKVISVEPNSNSKTRLEENFSLNKLSLFELFTNPLGEVSGLIMGLYVPESSTSAFGRRLESSGARFIESQNELVVIDKENWCKIDSRETLRLDDLIDNRIKIDAIKIDAEGMELEVLKGAKGIIELHHPELIIETWSAKKSAELNTLLEQFGYSKGQVIDDSDFNIQATNLYFTSYAKATTGKNLEN